MIFSANTEQFLNNLVASGAFSSADEAIAAAIQVLKEQAANGSSAKVEILPPDEWLKEFDRITKSRTGGNSHMDDSRESIYGDRGL